MSPGLKGVENHKDGPRSFFFLSSTTATSIRLILIVHRLSFRYYRVADTICSYILFSSLVNDRVARFLTFIEPEIIPDF
jgi:hypothetical protein